MFSEGDKPGKVVSKLCFLKVDKPGNIVSQPCFLTVHGQTSNVSYPMFLEDVQLKNTGTDSRTCWLNLLGSEVQVLI